MKPLREALFDYVVAVPAAMAVAGISAPLCIVNAQARREIYAANRKRAEDALTRASVLGRDILVQTGIAAVLVVIGPPLLAGEIVLEVADYALTIYDDITGDGGTNR